MWHLILAHVANTTTNKHMWYIILAHVANKHMHTYPITTRLSIGLSTDGLKDGLDVRPGFGGTTRHQRGAVASSLLPSTHSAPHKVDALLCQSLAATLRAVGRRQGEVSLGRCQFRKANKNRKAQEKFLYTKMRETRDQYSDQSVELVPHSIVSALSQHAYDL